MKPQQPTETSGSRHGATAGIDGGDPSSQRNKAAGRALRLRQVWGGPRGDEGVAACLVRRARTRGDQIHLPMRGVDLRALWAAAATQARLQLLQAQRRQVVARPPLREVGS